MVMGEGFIWWWGGAHMVVRGEDRCGYLEPYGA